MHTSTDPLEALMRRVIQQPDGCWIRDGAAVRGYPVLKIAGHQYRAARLSYELHVGAIPDGLTIDHLCRNTRCVNPEHLEPVSNAENARRGNAANRPTHCPQGHSYADHGWLNNGRTHCKACRAERLKAWKASNPQRWRELKAASARRAYARRHHPG